MNEPLPRKVAISYAWKPEAAGPSAGKVEEFCRHLQSLNVHVLRDVQGTKLGDSLSEFMRQLGTSDFLCVFLSEAYLRSPYCMYELLVAWESLRHRPNELRNRVKVWVMPDATDAHKPEGRIKWTEHWKAERDRLAPQISKHATDGLASAELEAFNRVKRFADSVNDILCFVADTLSPTSIDDLNAWANKEFPPITPEERERLLTAIYDKTCSAVDDILAFYPKVREFLGSACPKLIAGGKLSPVARTRQFDGKQHFKDLAGKIGTFTAAPAEWDQLRDVVGGLATLVVSRTWVLDQRPKLESGEVVEYPGTDTELQFGDKRSARILHLLAASLADGVAQLTRMFGEPDERLIGAPAELARGLGIDRLREYKLHLIRAVLDPDALGRGFDESNERQVEERFANAKEFLAVALEEGRPFYATEPATKALHLAAGADQRAKALLLLVPDGSGSLRDLIPDPVHVFHSLHTIFTTIQRRILNA